MNSIHRNFACVIIMFFVFSTLAAELRTLVYSNDFESLPSGWSFVGQFEEGFTSLSNVCPYAHSGTQIMGSNLRGDYLPNQTAPLNNAQSPSIDITGSANLKLNFWSYSQFQGDEEDMGYLHLSVDMGEWILIDKIENHQERKWTKHYVDISDLADGHDNIRFRFSFISSDFYEFTGWNIDDFRVESLAPLSGTKTIDPAGVGSDNYQSFTEAIEDINLRGVVSSGLVLNVSANAVFDEEIPPLYSSGHGEFTRIIFQKSGAGANPMIISDGFVYGEEDAAFTLWGTNWIRLDRIDISSNSNFLEYGILISGNDMNQGAQHVEISNCNITILNSNCTGDGIYQRVLSYPNDALGTNSYNTFHHNTIQASSGITLANDFVLYTPFYDTSCQIYNNSISGYDPGTIYDVPQTSLGISAHGSFQAMIYQNEVYNLNASQGGMGIQCFWGDSGSIYRNSVHNLSINDPNSTFTLSGIRAEGARVYNNMVYNLTGFQDESYTDISIRGIVAGNKSDIHFNTVLISGAAEVHYNAVALLIEDAAITNYVRIRNNILANTLAHNVGVTSQYCIIAPSNVFALNYRGYSNNNVLYTGGGLSRVGKYGNLASEDIQSWQSDTMNDINSYDIDPQFIDTDDLHIVTGIMTPIESRASFSAGEFEITWLTDDFDGNPRSDSTPDIGADEGAFLPLYYPPLAASNFSPLDLAIDIPVNQNPILLWNINYGDTVFADPTFTFTYLSANYSLVNTLDPAALVQGDGSVVHYNYISPDNLLPQTTYYWRVVVGNPVGIEIGDVFSFTTGSDVLMVAFPQTQGFEGATFPPEYWVSAYNWEWDGGLNGNNLINMSMGGWIPDTNTANIYSGLKAATAPPMGQPSYDWLISPSLMLPENSNVELGFWLSYQRNAGSLGTFYVQIYASGTWTNLLSYNTEAQSTHYDSEIVLDLSLYSGEIVKLAFVVGPEFCFIPVSIDDITIRVSSLGYYSYTGSIPIGASILEVSAFALEGYDFSLLEMDTGTVNTEDIDVSMEFTAGDSPHPVPYPSLIGFTCSGSISDPSLSEIEVHFDYQGSRLTNIYQWNTALSAWVEVDLLIDIYSEASSSGTVLFILDLGPDYRNRNVGFEFIAATDNVLGISSPTNIQLQYLSPVSQKLSWQGNGPSTGYRIYYSTNPYSGWQLLAEVNPNTRQWFIDNPTQDKRFYRVTNIWEAE